MKAFLRHTATFALLVLLVFAAGEWYVRSLPNAARDKHRWMLAHSSEVETLVLGSSHAFYGVDPALLGSGAFSLAMPSQTYRYDDWLLHRYPMGKLRTLILPYSYFSLYEDYESGTGDDCTRRYRIYMDCPIHSRWSAYGLECLDFDSFKERLKSLYKPPRLSWTPLGWGSNNRLETRKPDWDNGAERAQSQTYADTSAVGLNTGFLRSMLSWCRSHGVKAVLISTPLSLSYRQHRLPAQLARNRRVLEGLLREFPEALYMDFEADGRFASPDFYDSDHLSDRGAEKLTRIIHRKIKGQCKGT